MDADECRRIYGTDVNPHAGKWRCAKCECIYDPPKNLRLGHLARCTGCGETEDVFPADDGGWERAEEEREMQGKRPLPIRKLIASGPVSVKGAKRATIGHQGTRKPARSKRGRGSQSRSKKKA